MDLNIPYIRQTALLARISDGRLLVATEVAREFGVSLDTVRRDILALEAEGKVRRVRGGAVPIARPADPLHKRLSEDPPISQVLINAALREVSDADTVLVDGGRTTLRVIEQLPAREGRLVVTPSPWVAIACHERRIPVFLMGGKLRPQGGIATGETAIDRVAGIRADVVLLGACGIDADFGLSSDDHDEALMKRAMHAAANRTTAVSEASKIGRRARHRTLALSDIDTVVTDANTQQTKSLNATGKTRVVNR